MNTFSAIKPTPGIFRPGHLYARLFVALIATGSLAPTDATAQGYFGADALRALAVETIERQLPDSDIARGANRTEVEAGAIDSRLRLAACDTPPRTEVDLSRGSGRYNARLSCAAPTPWSIYVPVEVRVYRDTVVANRALGRGETVGPDDVRLEERNVLAAGQSGLLGLEEAIGLELRRQVPANGMLTASALVAPLLVRRGERLQISAHAGGITVGATAEALRDGRRGERIPARNTQSKRVVEVIVTGPGRADIAP
jgi:flagella basal body P-ring formation protein FlgA